MTVIGLQQLLTRELMCLTGVSRCLSIRSYDVTRDQHILRWFGGGKTVGLRVPREVKLDDAILHARSAFEEWTAATAGPDDDSEYELLKRQAEAAGLGWCQEAYSDD